MKTNDLWLVQTGCEDKELWVYSSEVRRDLQSMGLQLNRIKPSDKEDEDSEFGPFPNVWDKEWRAKRPPQLQISTQQSKAMAIDQSSSSSMSTMASQICNQISSVFSSSSSSSSPLSIAVEEIAAAVVDRKGRVFVHGVGREGLMLKALCMRLCHLGISAHCVGDMTTPPISKSDLLIASAGPGGFSTVDAICGVARSNGTRVLLLTAQPGSGSATQFATAVAYLPAKTMAEEDGNGDEVMKRDLLPMGSVYEGALFVLFEMIVFKLGEVLGQTPDAIRSRHTNLE